MEKNFEVEVQPSTTNLHQSVQLPMNFLTFGEIENDDVKVYIKQNVYKDLEKFAASDTSRELGSIIIGEYCQEHGKTSVIISDYIEAKYTDASASTLTFTHKTWDYIHSEHERLYPDKKIVGWQHTHPNYGIFLSNYDLFIHENFFNLPFQIAYVIDPIQNLRGFFQWKDGKITKLKGYYIYDEVGTPIKIEQVKIAKNEKIVRKVSFWQTALAVFLCTAIVFLSLFMFLLNQKYKYQLNQQDELLEKIENQNVMLSNQADTISKLQDQLINIVLDNTGKTTAIDLIKMIENHELTIQNPDNVLKELNKFVEDQKNDEKVDNNNITFMVYTVMKDDNLLQICNDIGIDYNSNIGIILAINGIQNPDQIYIGQTILLPLSK